MHTFNQEIDSGSIRRETFDGREHLVAPITILKPMVLNTPHGEAYLPEAEAKRSAPAWNGTPLTLNHPSTPDGVGTTANTPGMLENVKLGQVFNAEADKSGKVKAEAWFDIEKIESMGGSALNALNAVLDGETVEVSSGYQADVAKNEHADGKARDKIQGNLRPDHVAVLPNDMGKCSVSDGCGVGVAANTVMVCTNADLSTNADDGETPEDVGVNYLSSARDPTYDDTETTSWGDVSKDLSHWTEALDIDAGSVDEMSQSEKETVAAHTLLGDAQGETWDEVLFFPVVNPSTSNLNAGALRAVLSGRGESQETVPESAEDSAQAKARDLLENEFDTSDNSGHTDEEMNTNESADTDTVNTMSDCNCENDDPETEEVEAETQPEEVSENEETIEISKEDLDSLITERVEERLAANKEQTQREELVGVITANSEDYSEESLSDTPVDVLESIAANVQGGVDFGPRGASPKPAANKEEVDTDIKLFGSDA